MDIKLLTRYLLPLDLWHLVYLGELSKFCTDEPRLIDAPGEWRPHGLSQQTSYCSSICQKKVNTGSDRKVWECTVCCSLLPMGLHSCRSVRVSVLTLSTTKSANNWHVSIRSGPQSNGWRLPGLMNQGLCDALDPGNFGSCPCGCYFDIHPLPNHCCRPCAPFVMDIRPFAVGPVFCVLLVKFCFCCILAQYWHLGARYHSTPRRV